MKKNGFATTIAKVIAVTTASTAPIYAGTIIAGKHSGLIPIGWQPYHNIILGPTRPPIVHGPVGGPIYHRPPIVHGPLRGPTPVYYPPIYQPVITAPPVPRW